jgi:hypothetical protein
MAVDLKIETPDETMLDDGYLFGADSQSAVKPSVYPIASVAEALPFTQDATDAIAMPLIGKFYNMVAPRDWGNIADGDPAGVTSFKKFIDALNEFGGKGILERGEYVANGGDIDLTRMGTSIEGQGAGNIANRFPATPADTTVKITGIGAGIRKRVQNIVTRNFRLTSDTARAALSFDINSPGIRVEPPDEANARADRAFMDRVRIDNHPGDGVLGVGPTTYLTTIDVDIYDCKGFGYRGDAGNFTGLTRTNQHYIGLWSLKNTRVGFCGGHALALSNHLSDFQNQMAVRCTVDNLDSFGNGANTAIMYTSPDGNFYDWWIFGEEFEARVSAMSGAAGLSLVRETLGGVCIGGRDNKLDNLRYIYTKQPVLITHNTTQPTTGTDIHKMRIVNEFLTHAAAVRIMSSATKGTRVTYDRVEYFTDIVTRRISGVATDVRTIFQANPDRTGGATGSGGATLADDTVLVIPIKGIQGTSTTITTGLILDIAGTSATSGTGKFHIRLHPDTPLATKIHGADSTIAHDGAGPLADGDGEDAKFSVSCDPTNIYISNRLGGSVSFSYQVSATAPGVCI